jgi:autotransporter-associated beta strand protein
VTLFGGTTLTVNNVALFQRDIVLATSGSGNNATLDAGEKFTSGTFTPGGASRLTGTITMPAGRTLTVLGPTTGQFELAGQITGGGALILGRTATPAGGVVYLTGPNDYSGGTTVQLLTALGVGSNTAFGTGAVTFTFAAPVFALNGNRTLANDLTLNAPLTAGPDGPYALINNLAFTGTTTLGTNGGPVTVNGGGMLSLNNVGGTPALTKAGVGTLALTGTASYTGTTAVNAGTLLVNGTLDGSGGTITVASGAALGGTGTINRPVVVNAGGILAPGASPGILTVNAAVSLDSGSVFAAELNGNDNSGATPQFDQLVLGPGGFLTLGGATLLPTLGAGYNPSTGGDSLTLISGAYSGTFGNGPNLTVGGFPAVVLYNPNAVVLQFSPVPEPAGVIAACAAAAGVAGWWHRRRR